MKIALSAIGIDHRAGTGRHVAQLVRHLAKVDRANDYLVFLSPGQMDDLKDVESAKNFRWFSVPTSVRNVVSGTIWNFTYFAAKLREEHVDLVHFLDANRCIAPHVCPTVFTVHGLIAAHVKNKDGWLRGVYHKKIMPRVLRRADHIIAVSQNTKSDVVDSLRVAESTVSVVPNGCTIWPSGDVDLRLCGNPRLSVVRSPFVLFVSRLEHPNKNHVRLLRAFKRFMTDSGRSMQLVLVGDPGWHFAVIEKEIGELELERDVVLAGFVTDLELKSLYLKARAFVMPSLYEGFGIPILEAMSLGVPVACSDTSSMAEIASNAALLFNPYSVDEIAEALNSVVHDERVRESLIRRGFERAAHYSWMNVAERTVDVYNDVASLSGR